MPIQAVKSESLNFRKQPAGTIIKALRIGKQVNVLGDADTPGWKSVRVKINGNEREGFVHGAFLRDLASSAKEDLMNAAIREWIRFNRGTGKEHHNPFFKYVGKMWASIGHNLDGKDRDVPWSAAFISSLVKKAGQNHASYNNFKFSAAHSRFIHQAIQRELMKVDGPFWGFPRTDHKPQLGDLVCQWRVTKRTFAYARDHNAFSSHTDLIVQVNDDSVRTIGGNVSHSVKMKTYGLNSSGMLRNEKKVIAILRNNL